MQSRVQSSLTCCLYASKLLSVVDSLMNSPFLSRGDISQPMLRAHGKYCSFKTTATNCGGEIVKYLGPSWKEYFPHTLQNSSKWAVEKCSRQQKSWWKNEKIGLFTDRSRQNKLSRLRSWLFHCLVTSLHISAPELGLWITSLHVSTKI